MRVPARGRGAAREGDMTERVGIAVIGAGLLGWVHAGHVAGSVPNARLAAVCDLDPAIRERAQDAWCVQTYSDLDAMLADPAVDAVLIATTSSTHPPLIARAARAGKHIYSEKPVALSVEAADEALREVLRAGVKFQIGFNRRWDPSFVAARRQIEAGVIGEPLIFKSSASDEPAPDPSWHDPRRSGGIFLDCMIHDYDAACYLTGRRIRRVYAQGATLVEKQLEAVGDLDVLATLFEFEGGGYGIAEWNLFGKHGHDVSTEVTGSQGIVRIQTSPPSPLTTITAAGFQRAPLTPFTVKLKEAYRAEVEGFAQAILDGRTPSPGIEEGRSGFYVGGGGAAPPPAARGWRCPRSRR